MLVRFLLNQLPPNARKYAGKATVFVMTYIAYALATGGRLPYSIAKATLRPSSVTKQTPGWAPFTDSNGQELLGLLDTVYMFGYACAMPFMGVIADRVNQPLFLSLALLLIGAMLIMVGMAERWEIHSYPFFLVFTLFGGAFQSICYPCVIANLSKWFGKSKIGFTLGIWSSCTPIGTIIGKLGTTAALENGWQDAFILPGIVIVITAIVMALCLVDDPYSVSLLRPGEARDRAANGEAAADSAEAMQELAASRAVEAAAEEPVPFSTIIRIPGLVSYCCACFFSKLSYYAFVFWLPFYLDHALHYDSSKAGQTSTLFDWGGFAGGIVGGILMDRLKLRGVVLLGFQSMAVVMLFIYMYLGLNHMLTDTVNYIVLACLGFTVTTPYSLILSVTATDLGRDPMLKGNIKAAATVTALLDGTGSFGAVLQGLVIGWISNTFGWAATFIMLMVFAAFSAVCLIRPSMKELRARRENGITPRDISLQPQSNGNENLLETECPPTCHA